MAQTSKLAKNLALNGSATTLPRLIYGTAWKKDHTADLVYAALKTGFRGIDTAAQPKHYNEQGVGQGVQKAVKDGIVRREDFYIQTKFSPPSSQGDTRPYDLDAPLAQQVHQSIKSSLAYFTIEGQTPYFDSVVMHTPLDTVEETITAWKALETHVPHAIRNLGISNVTLPVLQQLYDQVTVKPSIVQNRFHKHTGFEVNLRAFCREKGIVFQSFWTLSANAGAARSRPTHDVAEKTGVSLVAAYYSLVLGLEGITILVGTTDESHMKDDLQGLETIGLWAEGDGAADWQSALSKFKELIGEA
ncbi:hypothetical protein G7046_g8855 [Stylonectria norvegica]|nr:hypothetical protein G7046_g8855 [Stylonectria norvegica]